MISQNNQVLRTLIPLGLCLCFGAACKRAPVADSPVIEQKLAPVYLKLSNQSGSRRAIDFELLLDGERVWSGIAKYEHAHTVYKREIKVPPGVHTLTVRSKEGDTQASAQIDGGGPMHAYIAYWYESHRIEYLEPKFIISLSLTKVPFFGNIE